MNYEILKNSIWSSEDVDDPEKSYENNFVYDKLQLLDSFVSSYPTPFSYVIIADLIEEEGLSSLESIITGDMINQLILETNKFYPCQLSVDNFGDILKKCINISFIIYKTKGKITSENLFTVNEQFIDHIYEKLNQQLGCDVKPSYNQKLELAKILDITLKE